jgi:predicted RNase H-like HicB family nuclease
MTSLRLYSEDTDGRSILYALDLPGCYAEGVSEDEAFERFPLAWASYAELLVTRGDMAPQPPERFVIAERFASYVLSDGYEVNALFAPERHPPSRRFIARCQHLLGYSRANLLEAWQAIPADRQDAASAADKRTPQQILDHVARAEWWYQSHIAQHAEGPLRDHSPDSLAQLACARAALLDWLSTASGEELRIISVSDEEWSVRKVLRRALWHERTHTAELARCIGHVEQSRWTSGWRRA